MSDFGIYIHFPFCRSKCPYCDFVSSPLHQINFDLWEKRYEKDLEFFAKQTTDKKVRSIFFGGGTPSLIRPQTICFVIKTIKRLWEVEEDIEISLEANPCSIDEKKMLDLKKAGINRLSIGIQSLDNENLKFLGRLHTKEEALEVLKIAKQTFSSVSCDFIYGLPNRTLNEWERELEQILSLHLNHLSLYQLSIEEGSLFYKRGVKSVEEELSADLFERTDKMTSLVGLERYEISNHAIKGHECRHNLLYWQGGEWLGIGPAAHGRIKKGHEFIATAQTRFVEKWLKKESDEHDENQEILEQTILSKKQKAQELILMALRTKEGLNKKKFFDIIKKPVEDFLDKEILHDYEIDGFLRTNAESIKMTKDGIILLNALCTSLLL